MSGQPPQPPKLLDQVRTTIRLRGMSYQTEKAYADWIKRFIIFHNKRHPSDVSTTMVYTHVLNRGGLGVRSPLDRV